MRYTDLTNEELDALVEISKALSSKRISKLSFDLFMFGLNQKVKNRKSIALFKTEELTSRSIVEIPLD